MSLERETQRIRVLIRRLVAECSLRIPRQVKEITVPGGPARYAANISYSTINGRLWQVERPDVDLLKDVRQCVEIDVN